MLQEVLNKNDTLCDLKELENSHIRMLRQITQRHFRTIVKHHTYTINHDINMNRLHNACQAARQQH